MNNNSNRGGGMSVTGNKTLLWLKGACSAYKYFMDDIQHQVNPFFFLSLNPVNKCEYKISTALHSYS